MNGYRNPTRLCARGNFRPQLLSTLPAPNLHGTMTQEELRQLSQRVTVTVGQVSPWVTHNTSPQPGDPSNHRGCRLCTLGAVRRAGGGPLAGLTSVSISPTYPPPPTTSQPTWDSRSELRGTRANGFRELENSGQEQLSTAIRQVVISPLHTGHEILADTDTTRGNRQTSFRHTPSGGGGHRARQHAKHFAQTGLFFSSHPVEGAYSYFPTLQIKNRALQTSRGFQDLKSALLSPGWKLLLWVLQLCIS